MQDVASCAEWIRPARRIRKTALLFHFSLSARNRQESLKMLRLHQSCLFPMPAGWGGNKYFLVYRYLSKIIYLTVTLFDQWQLLPLEGLGKGRVIRKFREILIVQLVTHMMPRDK